MRYIYYYYSKPAILVLYPCADWRGNILKYQSRNRTSGEKGGRPTPLPNPPAHIHNPPPPPHPSHTLTPTHTHTHTA